MSIADVKYKELLQEVLDNGVWDSNGEVRPTYDDGTPAYSKSSFGHQVKFQPGELPIIGSKHTPVKGSINEVVQLFFKMKSVRIEDAEKLGIKYWKEWAQDDSTIGKSYGYQLAHQKELVTIKRDTKLERHEDSKYYLQDVKAGEQIWLNQVDSLLYNLKENPYSRRLMFSYWNPKHVYDKSLQECAWAGEFNIRGDQLDFCLIQRSVDLLLGIPTNWVGYYALQCAFANILGFKVGTFTHQMGNIHLYDNQIELAKKVITAEEYDQPTLWVNPEIKYFYDYKVDDIKVFDYQHGERIRSKPAI
ncbi:thymidylate synthase [Terribacillus aidingensis]|uniref:Thymidylate synthase n=1 Tax=Terribacillus aidingensis TaxID=586416 RepID=A0A285NKQ7_9BACI|nr:thymidylate synthase [Terribacillus aidingensis]SNZ10035.1 thymidylate synthase [Terribacillus aidingensis]